MSIWKSPVFYFGVLLVALITAALAAPFLVKWDDYKPDLERYGRKLTGRQVEIAGSVDVRLFPWPRLIARKVSIANQQGFGNAPLLTAENVHLNLSLAGLFSGTLEVQKVEVESPHINLQRMADGSVNWLLKSDEALNGLLSRVSLAEIEVRNGSIHLEDTSRQLKSNISRTNAVLTAQTFEGPWRMRGSGNWGEIPLSFTFNSNAYEAGQPFRFGTRLIPDDSTLPALSLDGEWQSQILTGKLQLNAQTDDTGKDTQKGSTEGSFRPLALQTEIGLSLDRITLDKIRIAPADVKDSGTLIEGFALLNLGSQPTADVQFKSPRVNLDTLVGANTLSRWRNGGLLAIANGLLANLPESLVTKYSLDVNVLTSGGETLNDVRVNGIAQKQAIDIYNASASLPGRSKIIFDGLIYPAPETAQLHGDLIFESNDLRNFAGWLMPSSRKTLETYWNGSRGTLNIKGELDWSGHRLALQKLSYVFEGQPGNGDLAIGMGDFPSLDLKLESKALDLDNLMTKGVSLASGDVGISLFGLLPALLADGQSTERRVSIAVESLTLNGVVANQLALEFASSLSGFEIKTLKVASINGASINGSGLVLQDGQGPSGDFKLEISAQNPAGLLQMAGLPRQGKMLAAVPVSHVLGATDAKVTISVLPGTDGPSLSFTAKGQSQSLQFNTTGTAKALERPENTWLEVSSLFEAPNAVSLTRLFGIEPVLPDGKPGKMIFKTAGSRVEGYDSTFDFACFDSQFSFKGHHDLVSDFGAVAGSAALTSENATALLAAIGLPFSPEKPLPLKLAGTFSAQDAELKLSEINGFLDGQSVAGQAALTTDGAISANIETQTLGLQDVLAVAFLPWNGPRPDLGDNFANPKENRLTGTLILSPKLLQTGLGKPQLETVLGIEFKPDQRSITLKQPGSDRMDLDILLKPRGSTFDISGKGRIGLDLAQFMTLSDKSALATGEGLLSGQFKSQGRSPYAVLSAMEGTGTFAVNDATLQQVTLKDFAKTITAVQSSTALSQILASLEKGPGSTIGARTVDIAIANGLATLAPIASTIDGSSLSLHVSLDLPEAAFTTKADVAILARPDWPPVSISYTGKPGQLEKRSGTAALAAKLGYDLLAKEMADLEKLQKQQAELVAKEEQQRRDDEERFAAYQAQRAELRQRQREIRLHADQRKRREDLLKTALAEALKAGDALNKLDLAKRRRQADVRKSLKAQP